MSVRRIRQLLWISATGLYMLAVATLLWPATARLDGSSASFSPHLETHVPGNSPSDSDTIADDLGQVAQVNLRRVLHDPAPPAPPPPPPVKPTPPLDIKLTGTIYDPGHCQALIQMPDGTIELKGVGDTAADAKILDIQEGKITVEYFGKSLVLSVPKEEGG